MASAYGCSCQHLGTHATSSDEGEGSSQTYRMEGGKASYSSGGIMMVSFSSSHLLQRRRSCCCLLRCRALSPIPREGSLTVRKGRPGADGEQEEEDATGSTSKSWPAASRTGPAATGGAAAIATSSQLRLCRSALVAFQRRGSGGCRVVDASVGALLHADF